MYRSATVFIAVALLQASALARQPVAPAQRNIIADVRGLIAKDDFATAETTLRAFVAQKGTTPDALEAMSWLGRGNLARKNLDEADRFATETYGLSLAALKTRGM